MISSTGSTFEKSMTWFVLSFCEIAVLRLRLHRRGHPMAAGVLYPIFGVLLSPIIAAAAIALSSVSVIANAIRLRTIRL